MEVDREIDYLLESIKRLGNESNGVYSVKYGVLFKDDAVANTLEALVGTLRAAKKRGLITFEGQMLLSPTHDSVPTYLDKPAQALGSELRKTFYPHRNPDFFHANHGSFGSAPNVILEQADALRKEWNAQPDAFWMEEIEPRFNEARAAVAKHILDCPVEKVTLIDNATTAATIVSQKIMWDTIKALKSGKQAPVILVTSSTYGAVKYAFEAFAERAGAIIESWTCPFPVSSPADIISAFTTAADALANKYPHRLALAVFDHIVSENALVMPIEHLIPAARKAGFAEVFVDGAHAPGHIDLRGQMEKLDVEFYTGNLHKWAFASAAAALFYFKEGEKAKLNYPVTSWNHGQGLAKESAMLATRDYSALLSAGAAVEFLEWLGPERVRSHLKTEAWKAANLLKDMWDTKIGQPAELAAGMVTIALPRGVEKFGEPVELRKQMRKMGFEMQTPLVSEGVWWCRISVPVWMEAGEFKRFGEAVLKVAGTGKL